VAVQAGEAGDLLVWPEGECWLPRIAVESVDATGAGDAFAAALAVALAEGRAWSEAGALASASAALATTVIGAQAGLPRRQAAEALLARVGYRTDLWRRRAGRDQIAVSFDAQKGGISMSIVKVIEILAQSDKGWEDAAQQALKETSKTVRNIQSIYIKEFQAIVENNQIVNFRVNAKISFLVESDWSRRFKTQL
jgi:flavin-binding protein dodecin